MTKPTIKEAELEIRERCYKKAISILGSSTYDQLAILNTIAQAHPEIVVMAHYKAFDDCEKMVHYLAKVENRSLTECIDKCWEMTSMDFDKAADFIKDIWMFI